MPRGRDRTDKDREVGVNEVVLEGEVGAEVNVVELPSGNTLAVVPLRVPRREGRRTSVPVTVWSPTPKVLCLREGAVVRIQGHLERRFWSAADGGRHSRLDVIADKLDVTS
jgi:single-stranded DNA-binding protein